MSSYTRADTPKQIDWEMLATHGWVVDNNDSFILGLYPNSDGSVCLAIQAPDDGGMRIFGMDWSNVLVMAERLNTAIKFAQEIQQENLKYEAAQMAVDAIERIKQGAQQWTP